MISRYFPVAIAVIMLFGLISCDRFYSYKVKGRFAESKPDNPTLTIEIKPELDLSISAYGLHRHATVDIYITNQSYDSLALNLENVTFESEEQSGILTIRHNRRKMERNDIIVIERNQHTEIRLFVDYYEGKAPPKFLSLKLGSIIDISTGEKFPLGTYDIIQYLAEEE